MAQLWTKDPQQPQGNCKLQKHLDWTAPSHKMLNIEVIQTSQPSQLAYCKGPHSYVS
jgi:hypothetical protein